MRSRLKKICSIIFIEILIEDLIWVDIFVGCLSIIRNKKLSTHPFANKENSSENSQDFRSIDWSRIQNKWLFINLLRLTASSYDIIEGFELLPPIVHCLILFTNLQALNSF